jgi:ribosomal protein S18 acetylase RimI-like enzyme
VTVRRATPADAEELTRLRLQMFHDLGEEHLPAELADRCLAAFTRRLRADEDFAAFVIDAGPPPPAGGPRLLSAGAGWVETRLPGPHRPDGRTGHIQSMCTDPTARGRGHGRAVFAALLEFLVARGARKIELHATDAGVRLYASFGFVPEGNAMALRVPSASLISS